MSFVEVLNHLMKETSTSNLALGKAVGISDTAVGKWRKGEYSPTLDNAMVIAEYFGITLDELVGLQHNSDGKYIRIPVIGTVSIYGVSPNKLWTEEYITIERSELKGYPLEECYSLACRDNTIPEHYENMSYLIFHQQKQCAEGDIVIMQNDNSEELMLKRFHWCDDSIELQCPNPNYKPILKRKQEINKLKILAVMIADYDVL